MRADVSTAGRRPPVPPLRRGWRAVLALGWLAVAACGAGGDGGAPDSSSGVSAGPSSTGEPVAADLSITARLDQGAEERQVVLTCPAEGSTEALWPGGPAVDRACAALADGEVLEALRPPPADQVCTEVYGGPEVATVSGTVAGARIDAQVDRTDGCGIARWDVLAPILPPLAR